MDFRIDASLVALQANSIDASRAPANHMLSLKHQFENQSWRKLKRFWLRISRMKFFSKRTKSFGVKIIQITRNLNNGPLIPKGPITKCLVLYLFSGAPLSLILTIRNLRVETPRMIRMVLRQVEERVRASPPLQNRIPNRIKEEHKFNQPSKF